MPAPYLQVKLKTFSKCSDLSSPVLFCFARVSYKVFVYIAAIVQLNKKAEKFSKSLDFALELKECATETCDILSQIEREPKDATAV